MRLMIKRALLLAGILALAPPALAQTIGGNASLTAGVATSRVALPVATSTYPAVILAPAPGQTQEVFYAFGGSLVGATLSSTSLPAGGLCFNNVGPNTYVAAITAANTAILRITQMKTCPPNIGFAGGSGGGSVTQGTSPWVDDLTQWANVALGAPSNFGTSPGTVAVPGVNAWVFNSSEAPLYVTPAAAANPWPVADSALLAAVNSSIPAGTNGIGTINSQYPTGAVPITASATGTTGATTATLTNVTAHTTYICGFSIRANATAAATGNATVTGTITGTLNFTQWTAPTASGLGVTEEIFTPCVPASAVSTSINAISAAPGTGGVVSVTAWGYSL